jgi:hypothetical protein
MFTDALLKVLRSGDSQCAPYLTLAEVQSLAWERLQGYSNPVRPVLHSPDQSEGDIAAIVGLFPNLALSGSIGPTYSNTHLPATPAGHMPEHSRAAEIHLWPAPSNYIDEELIKQVLQQLTKLVGPIAPILITKARKQATDFQSFIQSIADKLDEKERHHFLAAVEMLRRSRK